MGFRTMAAFGRPFVLPGNRRRQSGEGHTLLTMHTRLTIAGGIVKRVGTIGKKFPREV